MEELARSKARTAGIALLVMGVVEVLFLLVWSVWSVLSTVVGLAGTGVSALAASESGDMVGAGLAAWGSVIDVVQLVGNFLLIVPALVVVVGGMRLMAQRSRGVALLGAICSAGVPIVSLGFGVLSIASFDCCGLVCGSTPTLVVAIFGSVVGLWALLALRDPMVVEVFE